MKEWNEFPEKVREMVVELVKYIDDAVDRWIGEYGDEATEEVLEAIDAYFGWGSKHPVREWVEEYVDDY